jgi:hypothetical protein
MKKVVSEDAVRRALSKIEEEAGRNWLQEQLDYCTRPLLQGAVDTRCRYHGQTALRPSRRSRGRLQLEEAWAAPGLRRGRLAHLPQLHSGQFALGIGSRGSGREPAPGETFGPGAVGAVGSARAGLCALAAALRIRTGAMRS